MTGSNPYAKNVSIKPKRVAIVTIALDKNDCTLYKEETVSGEKAKKKFQDKIFETKP